MSDIFISYAKEDRTAAGRVAGLLEERGWTVWWDRKILAGKTFDELIENELNLARCVIVLWSNVSVSSSWVKAEAAEGARRGILVPILLENVRVPLEFRRLQTITFSNWQGDMFESELADLFSALDAVFGDTRTSEISRASQPQLPGPPGSPEGTISESTQWYAELVSKSGTERAIRVHLSNERHVIEARFHLLTSGRSDLVVKLDGNPVAENNAAFGRATELSFVIRDSAQQYPATRKLWPAKIALTSLTRGIQKARLRISDHTLYNEDDD